MRKIQTDRIVEKFRIIPDLRSSANFLARKICGIIKKRQRMGTFSFVFEPMCSQIQLLISFSMKDGPCWRPLGLCVSGCYHMVSIPRGAILKEILFEITKRKRKYQEKTMIEEIEHVAAHELRHVCQHLIMNDTQYFRIVNFFGSDQTTVPGIRKYLSSPLEVDAYVYEIACQALQTGKTFDQVAHETAALMRFDCDGMNIKQTRPIFSNVIKKWKRHARRLCCRQLPRERRECVESRAF